MTTVSSTIPSFGTQIFPMSLSSNTNIPDLYYAFWSNLITGPFTITIASTGNLVIYG